MTREVKQKKHVPMRMCLVSRVRKPKNELIRIVRTKDGEVKVDLKGKLSGRGASIDMDLDLFDTAINKKLLKKALRLEKALTEDNISKLRKDFSDAIEEKNFRNSNKPVKIRISKDQIAKLKDADKIEKSKET